MAVFGAEVSFNELVRTLGLACVWRAIGVLSVLANFSEGTSFALGPVQILVVIGMTVVWFITPLCLAVVPGF